MSQRGQTTCLVTGGASGLGRETAFRFAKAGYNVVIGDIDENAGAQTAADIVGRGGQALFQRTDVARSDDLRDLVSLAVDSFGKLDCAVNNAGIEGRRCYLTEFDESEAQKLFEVNFLGVFSAMKHEIRAMIQTGGGAIVNVGSSAGLRGTPRMAAYCGTKHALEGLTKSAALEYASQGIRVNIIAPGSFRTPMSERLYGADIDQSISSVTPMRRVGDPAEVAQAIYWLASPEASFVTGASLNVDGGKMAGPVIGVTALWKAEDA
jgi:NAD(P)-dependent dehydrogenase (short-subunit alcohol dehydrogenase family)